jgi:hypothetical protein
MKQELPNIGAQIESWTAQNSHFEESRSYISMSAASKNPIEIAEGYLNGQKADLHARLKCYKGYQMEKDLLNRLEAIYGCQLERHPELSAFDGWVKGHPDGKLTLPEFEQPIYLDCKSVNLNEHLPSVETIPYKVFMQLQAYMLFSNTKLGLIIYESRQSGLIRHFWTRPVRKIQEQIMDKYAHALEIVRKTLTPEF